MEVIDIVGGVILSIGGGAAIVGGCSNWLGKIWADKLMEKEKSKFARELEREKSNFARDLEQLKYSMLRESESYKIKLKKSEFIFQKEFEAACEFSALLQRLLPKHKHFLESDMEWLDDLSKAEGRSSEIERELGDFLINHGAVIDESIKLDLKSCIESAINNRFSADMLSDPFAGSEIRHIYTRLQHTEQRIIANFREQSTN